MSENGRILTFDPALSPSSSPAASSADIPELTPAETLAELVQLIEAEEQSPITQLSGFLITDDPTYLPEIGHARALARRVGRDKLLETLIELYMSGLTAAPSEEV